MGTQAELTAQAGKPEEQVCTGLSNLHRQSCRGLERTSSVKPGRGVGARPEPGCGLSPGAGNSRAGGRERRPQAGWVGPRAPGPWGSHMWQEHAGLRNRDPPVATPLAALPQTALCSCTPASWKREAEGVSSCTLQLMHTPTRGCKRDGTECEDCVYVCVAVCMCRSACVWSVSLCAVPTCMSEHLVHTRAVHLPVSWHAHTCLAVCLHCTRSPGKSPASFQYHSSITGSHGAGVGPSEQLGGWSAAGTPAPLCAVQPQGVDKKVSTQGREGLAAFCAHTGLCTGSPAAHEAGTEPDSWSRDGERHAGLLFLRPCPCAPAPGAGHGSRAGPFFLGGVCNHAPGATWRTAPKGHRGRSAAATEGPGGSWSLPHLSLGVGSPLPRQLHFTP